MSIYSYIKEYLNGRKKKRRLHAAVGDFPILTKLHGVKSPDRQGALAQSAEGDGLQLVHVPLPEYPHNVYAYSIPLNRILGYLDKPLAESLLEYFGNGFCLDGETVHITGGAPYAYFGCEILVFPSKSFLSDCKDFSHLYP